MPCPADRWQGGQILNLNSLANDVGISHPTARGWMTLLEASYVVFLLPPWFGNVSKLIKSPKLYFHDVVLASYLLGLEIERQVGRDPLRGNLFENLAVVEALKNRWNRGKRSNLNFYRDSRGNEVDLLVSIGPDLFPVEINPPTPRSFGFINRVDERRGRHGMCALEGGTFFAERDDDSFVGLRFDADHRII